MNYSRKGGRKMITLTWSTLNGNKRHIELIRSLDKARALLMSLKRIEHSDGTPPQFHKIDGKGKSKVEEVLVAVSYDDVEELALLRKFGILPQENEYD